MEPEEIDKLFKDRLAGLPAKPSADAWMRLQQKMEPPKKARSMWIYYAAATVTLLIIAGALFFTQQSNFNNGTLATANKPKASNLAPLKTDAPAIIIPEELKNTENQIAQAEKVVPEVKQKSTAQKLATIKPAQRANQPIIAKAQKSKKVKGIRIKDKASLPANTPTLPALEPEERLAQVKQNKPALANALTANVVEVRIKRDTPEEGERSELRENLARKTSLLKNIYKQARNLKNGEEVELASLGINTEKINSEKKELKEKLNKVISL